MPVSFQKILVPVDFSINTEVAVKKCIEIMEGYQSVIYLMHVETGWSAWNISAFKGPFFTNIWRKKYDDVATQDKLAQWKNTLKENCPGIEVVNICMEAGNIEKAIVAKARELSPDVIIIGKKSHHNWFPSLNTVIPNHVAKKTGCPVLTVKPGSIYNSIKSVVVPVGSFLPKRKVELIIALRKKFRIRIHLVTIIGSKYNSNEFSAYALLNTYRFLKDVVQCPLEHEVLHGDSIARSSLKYAQQIKADMLVVDPETETKLNSFPVRHISDELMPNSRLQILSVQQ